MEKARTAPLSTIFALLVLAQLCCALDQDVFVDINATSVTRLIAVNASFGDMQMLPGYEYSSDLAVNWAVPDSALVGIAADRVTVFVEVQVGENSSQFYFKDNGARRNETFLTLDCAVANGLCSGGSNLSRTVKLYTTLADVSSSNDSGMLWVMASLKPFSEFEPIYNESVDLGKQVDSLRDALASLNISDVNKSIINSSLDEVQSLLTTYHVDEAKAKLDEIKPAMGVSTDLFGGLSLAIASLGGNFAELAKDLPLFAALAIGLVIFAAALLSKLRFGTKLAISAVSLAAMVAAYMKLVDAPMLIAAELVLAALPLAIVMLWRKNSRSRASYRLSDEYGE
ncbi:Uncharacterised protein [uncultured archaeon]|nr:Uncharacterised protein [uncultured archaeon]